MSHRTRRAPLTPLQDNHVQPDSNAQDTQQQVGPAFQQWLSKCMQPCNACALLGPTLCPPHPQAPMALLGAGKGARPPKEQAGGAEGRERTLLQPADAHPHPSRAEAARSLRRRRQRRRQQDPAAHAAHALPAPRPRSAGEAASQDARAPDAPPALRRRRQAGGAGFALQASSRPLHIPA